MNIYPILKDFFNWMCKYKKSLLIKEEKEILSLALKNQHEIYLCSTDQNGDYIQGFFYEDDSDKIKLYVYALQTLREKGLVEQVSEKRYKLTAQGFERAKKL